MFYSKMCGLANFLVAYVVTTTTPERYAFSPEALLATHSMKADDGHFKSVRASAQWDLRLSFTSEESNNRAPIKGIDRTGVVQVDRGIRWTHMPTCTFCLTPCLI